MLAETIAIFQEGLGVILLDRPSIRKFLGGMAVRFAVWSRSAKTQIAPRKPIAAAPTLGNAMNYHYKEC
jgi:hypothetical protein